MKKRSAILVILSLALCLVNIGQAAALEEEFPTFSVYFAFTVPGAHLPYYIEVSTKFDRTDKKQIAAAIKAMNCIVGEISANLVSKNNGEGVLTYINERKPTGLKVSGWTEDKNDRSGWRLIDLDKPELSAEAVWDFLRYEIGVENIFSISDSCKNFDCVDIRFKLTSTTDSTYYTVVPYRQGEEISTKTAGFKNIKMQKDGCECNYAPSSRITLIIHEYLRQ